MLNAVKAQEDAEYEDCKRAGMKFGWEATDGWSLPGLLPYHPNSLSLVPLGPSWRIARFSIARCARRKP